MKYQPISQRRRRSAALEKNGGQLVAIISFLVLVFLALNAGLIFLRIDGFGIFLMPSFVIGFALVAAAVASSSASGGETGAKERTLPRTIAISATAIVAGTAAGLLATVIDVFVELVKVKWIGLHSLVAAAMAICCVPSLLRVFQGRRGEG